LDHLFWKNKRNNTSSSACHSNNTPIFHDDGIHNLIYFWLLSHQAALIILIPAFSKSGISRLQAFILSILLIELCSKWNQLFKTDQSVGLSRSNNLAGFLNKVSKIIININWSNINYKIIL
jgi:hypothetical protein